VSELGQRLQSAFNPLENIRDIFVRPNQRFAMIDGIRGLSLLYIFLFHSMLAMEVVFGPGFADFIHNTPIELQWVLMGDLSVDAFFVISGFLIAQLLFREHQKNGAINLKRFYIRRWLRLTPAYYSAILLYLAIMPEFQPIYAWVYALYLNNFLDNQHNYMAFAWSLAVEEQFYILFALFLVLFFYRIKHKLALLLGLFFMSFVIRALLLVANPELLLNGDTLLLEPHGIGDKYWEVIYDNLYTRYGAIMVGVILGYLYVYHWQAVSRFMTVSRSNILLLIVLVILVVMWRIPLYNGEPTPQWLLYIFHVCYRNIFSVCIGVLVMVCLFPFGLARIVNSFLSLRLLFPFSQLSYSAYLLHMPIIISMAFLLKASGIIQQAGWANVWLVFGCSLAPIFFFSALAFIVIEKPFMKLRN
jgi:peptidoglycan/LPS O-acetylase OafA/YrhL